MPIPIETKVLLGWMPRRQALMVLTELCIEPYTEADALRVWEEYRAKVAALPPGRCQMPNRFRINLTEEHEIKQFRKRRNVCTGAVVKVDPRHLVVRQLLVVVDQSRARVGEFKDKRASARACLGLRATQQPLVTRTGKDITIALPHFEFLLGAQAGGIALVEQPGYISAVKLTDRMLLWAGYHRTYAFCSQMVPEADGTPVPLITLMEGAGDVDRFLGAGSPEPELRDAVLGDRPPMFRDFLDTELCITLMLRKQRREIFIKNGDVSAAQWRFVDM